MTVVVAPLSPTPAQAADTNVCAPTASVFAVLSSGPLRRYTLSNPGSTNTGWTNEQVGHAGWQNFGRVLAGPDNRVYGIGSTGLLRYRWLGPGAIWEQKEGLTAWPISSNFTEYATAALRNKITVDERGDFYSVDATGRLRWSRFDEPTKTWLVDRRVIDTGWDRYNLIVAAGDGVVYGRAANGQLHRSRFDPHSQRWLVQHQLVHTGNWGTFPKGIFSAGGDTLYGIQAGGNLLQYRYREDNNSWVINGRQIGAGWQVFPDVGASTNVCKLTASHTPERPTVQAENYAPTAAMQAKPNGTALGTLEFAHTDNIGGVWHGTMDPSNVNTLRWEPIEVSDAYVGKPALVDYTDGRVNIIAQGLSSDAYQLGQATANVAGWKPWLNLGGRMSSQPSAVRLSDNTLAVFALDAAGAPWFRQQDGTTGDLMGWRKLAGTGFTGAPVVTVGAERAAFLTVRDSAGTLHTATYKDGALSAWVSLGGSGFTGNASVVVLPGQRRMVFARHGDGTVQTQFQNADGTFPGTWGQVGDASITAAGSPSAALSPNSGRVSVVVRGPDGIIYYSAQTAQGSQTWRDWIIARPDSVSESYPTDPTMLTYRANNGMNLGFVVRTAANGGRLYEIVEPPAREGARASTAEPSFVRQVMPALPTR
ncbi:tachylectin-related carbohydrate-binding protein [Plantactinospora soyae]|uniref:Tachylectin 2 domain-containing protein n=1 Tax=Plantactinospora soyae TaxID=1544732 RepID=A0A927MF15_9ACTN|nr:tachylectin-related carbohydrate-binding protein [Plantactinospora soyae]MBE1492567.1 hypothetical protein [Plantactinospora soyae]